MHSAIEQGKFVLKECETNHYMILLTVSGWEILCQILLHRVLESIEIETGETTIV